MKYLSTFTGVGGFELAIHKTFKNAKCVGYSEIDKFAIQTYEKNFPKHKGKNFGDIERLVFDLDKKGNFVVNEARVKMLPDFDLLVGGSPCQDFSSLNNNGKGLKGLKSRLFFAYLEILRIKKPKYFILENVASMKNESKNEITKYLSSLDYDINCEEINSKLVSVQSRPRIYWANWKFGQPEEVIDLKLKRNGVIVHAYSRSKRPDGSLDERIRKDGKANTITRSKRNKDSINFIPDKELFFEPRKVWDDKELFFHKIKNDWLLTSNEKEICQCFPIDFTAGVSESQRNNQIGNAVNVKVIEHILKPINNQITMEF